MSILVLGSHSYQLVPDVNGDPLIVSPGGDIPALESGAGVPSGVPTYGTGTVYVDTTNFTQYIYDGVAWDQLCVVPTGLVRVIDKSVIQAVITTAGPNNTYSYTVPGGTLGTGGMLRLKMAGRWLNGNSGTRTVTVAVSYGGTTLWSDTSTTLAINGVLGWNMEFTLAANNSVTSQTLTGNVFLGGTGTTTTGLVGDLSTDEITGIATLVGNTAAVDSAVNQAFNVTVTFSGTISAWTKYYHTLELL